TKIAHATYNDDGLRLFPAGVLPAGRLPVDADGQVRRVRPALQCARLLIAGPDARARAVGDAVVLLRMESSRHGIAQRGGREHVAGFVVHIRQVQSPQAAVDDVEAQPHAAGRTVTAARPAI